METRTEIEKQLPNGCVNIACLWHRSLVPFLLARAKWFHYTNTYHRCLGREAKDYLYLTVELHSNFSLESQRLEMTHSGRNLKLLNTNTKCKHRRGSVCLHAAVMFC